jgi:hypothetical protein
MDYNLTLAPDGSYAVLTIDKDVTPASTVERQRAMQAFATAHGVSRFLLDTRGKRYTGSDFDLYTFARRTLPTESFDRRWRVALVTSHDDDSHDFLETVARNVGYNVMVFKDYDKGVAWLTGDHLTTWELALLMR